ncbi:MAG: ribosome-associated protein [Cocleimonas sp.]|jgi:ribosome-associated protein
MKMNELSDLVQNSLEDMKAVDIVKLDVVGKSSMTDILYIATGNSTRHVKSIAESVVVDAKAAKADVIGTEGKGSAEWVLVDLNSVIVHVMLATTREFYALEKLWAADDATDQSVEEAISDKG